MCLSSTCPRCGYQPDEPYSASPSNHLLDESHILERAQQIEGIIERLQRERIELLQGHNRLKATTKALPNEILSNIFQFAHPVFNNENHPFFRAELDNAKDDSRHRMMEDHLSRLTLGAVSSHWRRTAWSTPYLWTSLTLEVNTGNVNLCADIIKLFLENSRSLPFSLELDFRRWQEVDTNTSQDPEEGGFKPKNQVSLDPVRDILFFGHPEKLKDFRLIAPPIEWLPLPSTRFTILEELSLGWPQLEGFITDEPDEPLSLEGFPHLQRLAISFLESDIRVPVLLNWSTITDLALERVDIDTCIRLFAQCENLRSFRCCRSHDDIWPIDRELPMPPRLYPHLEHLEWGSSENEEEYTAQLLCRLELPSIRTLILRGEFDVLESEYSGILEGFFSRLPTTFTSLSLIHTAICYEDEEFPPFESYIRSSFRFMPSLEYLYLSGTRAIIVNTTFEQLAQTPPMLPNIRTLEFRDYYCHCQVDDNDSKIDADVIEGVLDERNDYGDNPQLSIKTDLGDSCEICHWERGIQGEYY